MTLIRGQPLISQGKPVRCWHRLQLHRTTKVSRQGRQSASEGAHLHTLGDEGEQLAHAQRHQLLTVRQDLVRGHHGSHAPQSHPLHLLQQPWGHLPRQWLAMEPARTMAPTDHVVLLLRALLVVWESFKILLYLLQQPWGHLAS